MRTSNRRVLTSLIAGLGAMLAVAFLGVMGAAPTGAQTPTTECTAVYDGDLEKYLADLALCGASTETSADSSTTSTTASGRSSSSGTSSSGTGSSTLPTTGSNTAPLLAVGGALVLVGGAAVYGSTRVRRTA